MLHQMNLYLNRLPIFIEKAAEIDVVVNNAGYALLGAVEDLSMEELRAQFETNFFGAVRVTKARSSHNEETEEWNHS